jgi:DNA-binding NarL/FixJ family response regulator
MLVKVALADDHQVVLDGLKALVAAEPDFRLCGEAKNGLDVAPLCAQAHPDVLVLDLMMPGLSGLEVARLLAEKVPATRVVVLSMHADLAYVAAALSAGAAGYVLKSADSGELLQAIRAVAQGGRYLSAPLDDASLTAWRERAGAAPVDPYATLTTREREVLQLVAEGLSNGEVAGRLDIGRRTVETHRANLMRKLALRSQAELVRYAVRRGIVSAG